MREQFSDPMFVRSSKGVTPTDFSISIANEVFSLVQRVETLYRKGKDFVPANSHRHLSMAVGDYFALTHLKKFSAQLQKEAPHLKLTCYPDSEIITPDKFETGEIHLGISGFLDVEVKQGFHSEVLVADRVTCIARKSHPIFKKSVTLEDYLESEHMFVSVNGASSGMVDIKLSQLKKKRKVTKVAPSFFAAGAMLSSTNSILTGPHLINLSIAKSHGLKVFEAPFEEIPFPVKLYWHQRTEEDSLLIWVRDLLRKVCS